MTSKPYAFTSRETGRTCLISRAMALFLLEPWYPDPVEALLRLEREGGLAVWKGQITVIQEGQYE